MNNSTNQDAVNLLLLADIVLDGEPPQFMFLEQAHTLPPYSSESSSFILDDALLRRIIAYSWLLSAFFSLSLSLWHFSGLVTLSQKKLYGIKYHNNKFFPLVSFDSSKVKG